MIHQFDPAVYPYKLWVTVTNDLTEIRERFKTFPERRNLSTDEFGEVCAALTEQVIDATEEKGFIGAVVAFNKSEDMTPKMMAHEATHVAQLLWNFIGEDNIGTEAEAYFIGWVTDCIDIVKNGE